MYDAVELYYVKLSEYLYGDLDEEEKEHFESEYYGIYYYIEEAKEKHTNIPNNIAPTDFSMQENVKTIPIDLTWESMEYKTERKDEETTQIGNQIQHSTDYLFIDLNAGSFLASKFRYDIEHGLNQQKVLYIESGIFIMTSLFSAVLLLFVFRQRKELALLYKRIPIDSILAMPVFAGMTWVFLMDTYSRYISSFFNIRNRIIFFAVYVGLAFVCLYFFIGFIVKMMVYRQDREQFKIDWETRLTSRVPEWLMGLFMVIVGYFIVFFSFSERTFIYDYMVVLRENMMKVSTHLLVIIFVFLFIRKLQASRNKYNQMVIDAIRQISQGNFDMVAPVIGNDSFAQIANYVNGISKNSIKALEELKKSEGQKYELVTNISHDLRTPLTNIINYLGLAKKVGIPEHMKNYTNHMETNLQNLNLLIEDLFELSKIESGSVQLEKGDVDIVLLLKQIIHEYEEIAKKNNTNFEMRSDQKKHVVSCDSLKMWRVFDNLIQNALKYSLENTRIYITVLAKETNKLSISVKNVSSYKMEFDPDELFLRFKRGDEARSTNGSGLGLAIAKGLTELHGGSIYVETEGDMFKIWVDLNIC